MKISLVFLILLYIADPAAAHAEVYKYIDENGVVSFTDDFSKVPENQRPTVAPEQPRPFVSTFTTPTPPPQAALLKWFSQPLSKYIIAFAALAVFMLFIQSRTEGLFLRLIVKLLFIGFLGAAIYSVLIAEGLRRKPEASSFPPLQAIESALPDPAVIGKIKKQVEQIEEQQKQGEARIRSLSPLDLENHQ